MFSKTADPTTAPNQPIPTSDSRSTLAAGLKIVGDLVTTGAIDVLGEVEGMVAAGSLTIGSNGRIAGHIAANAVEVKGTLSGTVECHSLTLRSTAVVTADVTYALLVIENGAQIEGRMVKIKA